MIVKEHLIKNTRCAFTKPEQMIISDDIIMEIIQILYTWEAVFVNLRYIAKLCQNCFSYLKRKVESVTIDQDKH